MSPALGGGRDLSRADGGGAKAHALHISYTRRSRAPPKLLMGAGITARIRPFHRSGGGPPKLQRDVVSCGLPSPRTPVISNGGAMSWIVANIHRVMIVSGVLTMTMIYAALAPEAALRSTFGESVSGPVADIVVRNWGALIALVGAMLIYAARRPAARPLALAEQSDFHHVGSLAWRTLSRLPNRDRSRR